MADRRRLGPEHHADHDLELVARAAAGDLAAAEAIAARDLLAACDACEALAVDLRAIAAVMRAIPRTTLAAPRDFRISPADAARIGRRRRPDLSRFGLAAGRARGLGGALATLGLVGILVSAGAPALLGGAGGAASDLAAEAGRNGSASKAPEFGPAQSDVNALTATGAAPGPDIQSRSIEEAAASPWAILALLSVVALVAGLSLLLATRSGRRAGP
ncbi:MAG: hypothetical protein HYX57_01350 [Chloroflexi bacterium]|nr:hypothetical protein [Chloroflexota bacterium]